MFYLSLSISRKKPFFLSLSQSLAAGIGLARVKNRTRCRTHSADRAPPRDQGEIDATGYSTASPTHNRPDQERRGRLALRWWRLVPSCVRQPEAVDFPLHPEREAERNGPWRSGRGVGRPPSFNRALIKRDDEPSADRLQNGDEVNEPAISRAPVLWRSLR